jgi:methyl-accepting chemotaxis protein
LNTEISDLVVNFKINLSDAVGSYIDGLDIDELRRQELRQSIFDLIESSQSNIDNPVEYRSPSILGEIIQEITKAGVDVVLDNLTNPEVILPLLSVPIILWLKSLRFIGDKIAPFLDPIIIILAIAFVWRVISSDRTKRLNEAKRKIVERLLASFDKQKFINDSYQSFVEAIDEITSAVQEELQDVTDPYSKDVRRIADGVKDFQIEVKTINKFLQNQIAVIESEQV